MRLLTLPGVGFTEAVSPEPKPTPFQSDLLCGDGSILNVGFQGGIQNAARNWAAMVLGAGHVATRDHVESMLRSLRDKDRNRRRIAGAGGRQAWVLRAFSFRWCPNMLGKLVRGNLRLGFRSHE